MTNALSGGGLPDPGGYISVGWLVVALAAVLVIIRNALGLWRELLRPPGPERREIQQPLEVKALQELAREKDCLARTEMLQRQLDQARAQREADEREGSLHRKAIYDKIESVRKELGEKIDQMAPQIVSQLLNTKNLWRER